MYSPHRRPRPWSPNEHDPLPTISRHHVPNETSYDLDFEYSRYPRNNQRREPSDASVEALDLADYAVRRQQGYASDNVLNSPPPPSLTMASSSGPSSSRTSRRPFSLPPRSPPNRQHEPDFLTPENQDIDISRFPAWSRSWYNSQSSPSSPPDIYSPLPLSHLNSVNYKSRHKSTVSKPFDQGNSWDPYSTTTGNPNSRYGSLGYNNNYWNDPPPLSTFSHESSRNLLPWQEQHRLNSDDLGINPALKEERIRMLEREFGPDAASSSHSRNQDPNSPFLFDDQGKPLIGTVSPSGYITTQGPKKRLSVRVLEIVFAAIAAVPAIYAAAMIKFREKEELPPPQGKPPAYVLYVVSVITLLGLLVMCVAYPCCCGRRRKVKAGGPGEMMGPGGMMVLPVVQGLTGKNGTKNKKQGGGKKYKGGPGPGGDVQVNLIVDPTMFGNGGRQEEDDASDEEYNEYYGSSASMPGAYGPSRKKRKPRRRNVFVGLQMEEEWKRARGFLKKVATMDVLGVVVWGAVFIFILIGKRCPIGGFNGWCNAYNTSSAAACLLCVAFGVSVFFDIKDLHASKESPRTRS
ncbi:hypothetical protein E1B28_008966 [Marasmius oreades]|uniref:Uncharacterized protein n=1 Tax=Marasmius oreades TaxID=181124 RepID=A0A9P7S124_9AGAR|nr:uncharacterized protein E1B28_008966 [Marasmius oreades]KAG7092623.1 hypothetical protein E1B28_008966 [Marasmius oreades]